MEPKIRNFAAIEQLIRQKPQHAQQLSSEWASFTKQHPEAAACKTPEDWYTWIDENPQINIDPDLWVSKEINDAYAFVRTEHQQTPEYQSDESHSSSHAESNFAIVLLPFLIKKPNSIYEDPRYHKIYKDLQDGWLKKHNTDNFDSKEGLDYLYGSLENVNIPSIEDESKRLFQEKHQRKWKFYQKKAEKTYKDPKEDPEIQRTNELINKHTKERINLAKKNATTEVNEDEIAEKVKKITWERFATQNSTKANTYSSHTEINKALERRELGYEKTHYDHSGPGVLEATKRLEEITNNAAVPRTGEINIVDPGGRTISTIFSKQTQQFYVPISSETTTTIPQPPPQPDNQPPPPSPPQPQAQPRGGKGVNPLSALSPRKQARLLMQGARFLASLIPYLLNPTTIVIVLVLLFTISIAMGIGGGPSGDTVSAPGAPGTPGTPEVSPPTDGNYIQAMKNRFRINIEGAWSEKHLKWMYDKFVQLEGTNFWSLIVDGEQIALCDCGPNQLSGYVQMSQTGAFEDKEVFLGVLLHELGHTIYHKNTDDISLKTAHNNLYGKIGAVSNYSGAATDTTENYPEMIAICLQGRGARETVYQTRWSNTYKPLATKILGSCYY